MKESISLETIANGAAVERFNEALKSVLTNIHDINTPATEVRELHLVFKFKPNVARELAAVTITPKLKLATMSPYETQVFISEQEGEIRGFEMNPNQLQMFDDNDTKKPEPIDGWKVKPIR
jgi:hypothetical protein